MTAGDGIRPMAPVDQASGGAPKGNAQRIAGFLVALIGFGIAAETLYATGFGLFYPIEQRAGIMLASAVLVIFLAYTPRGRLPRSRIARIARAVIDVALIVGAVWSIWHFMVVQTVMEKTIHELGDVDVIATAVGVLVLLELTRRVWGWTLFLVSAICCLYIIFGAGLPGILAHSGFSPDQFAENIWFNLNKGVFGTITNIVINIVLVFILFGVMLEGTGAGETLLKFSFRATRRTRGGPAHAAIVASSMFGTMSGSTVANIVGTGTFTIPLIKSRGFTPAFAGGIEATASSGGQIMPPIMGAAALVMADIAGVSYLFVIAAALLPAIFYYVSLFISVTVEARRQGIEPITDPGAYELKAADYWRSIMFVGPVLAVVLALVVGFSAAMAGFIALTVLSVVSFINPQIRRDPFRLIRSMIQGAITCAELMISVAAIGLIVAVLDTTGLGLKFAGLIEHLGSQDLFLSLLVAMVGALILGMGMPTLPAYLIIILIMGPAIKLLGLSTLTVHLFVFYYGVASSLTPPVAIAAYAAAPIAGANPITTALMSIRLGAAKFIIPFVFAYYPSLLLVEGFDMAEFAWIIVRLLIAIWLISTALSGFDRVRLTSWMVALRLALAMLMLVTLWQVQIPALLVGIAVIYIHWREGRVWPANSGLR